MDALISLLEFLNVKSMIVNKSGRVPFPTLISTEAVKVVAL